MYVPSVMHAYVLRFYTSLTPNGRFRLRTCSVCEIIAFLDKSCLPGNSKIYVLSLETKWSQPSLQFLVSTLFLFLPIMISCYTFP